MVKTIINEEVLLSYPDGFEEMDREQLKEALKKNQKAARVVIDAIENSISFTNDKK
jgi:hypothetical protein